MKAKAILSQNSFWTLPKNVTRLLGFDCAGYFSELVTQSEHHENKGKLDENGYFYYTSEWIEINTGLSRFIQNKSLQILKELGLISTKLKGLPAKVHYKINDEEIFNFFIAVEEFNEMNMGSKLDFKKFKNLFLKNLKTLYKEEVIIKEEKKSIKRKKFKRTTKPKKKVPIKDFYFEYPFFKNEFAEIWFNEFLPMKKKKGASLTDRALKSQLKKIAGFSNGEYETALTILEKSVNSGWTDFYALNTSKNNKPSNALGSRSGNTSRKKYGEGHAVYNKF